MAHLYKAAWAASTASTILPLATMASLNIVWELQYYITAYYSLRDTLIFFSCCPFLTGLTVYVSRDMRYIAKI